MQIIFSDKSTNRSRKLYGHKINDYLCVAERKIYNYKIGLPVIDCWFQSTGDARWFAETLDKVYAAYWPLLETGENIWELTKHTVPHGQRLCTLISMMEEGHDGRRAKKPYTKQTITDLAKDVS